MKRMIMRLSFAFFLIWGQDTIAGASGLLFNVSATGIPADVSITLCLNGKGSLSCQNYNVSALTLSISTAAPNHVYPFTGIKINTLGYSLGNLGLDCTPYDNGYCLFSVSDSQAKTISLVVNNRLSITPTTLPMATVNTFYSETITASGGFAPYIYAVSASLLPTGLSLNTSSGMISGTPTIDSTSSFTVTATDSSSPSVNGYQAYSVVVSGGLILTPTTLPAGTISTAYSQAITVDSIATPISYSVTSGSLPPGLTLSSSTGVISGTPTTEGTYPFTITATDASANTGSRGYSVDVNIFAYITNSNNNTVSQCNRNTSTGALSNCASTGSGFDSPYGVAITNGFAYVANSSNTTVSQCTVNSLTGTLSGCTPTGSGFSGPAAIALNNGYAYIANVNNSTISKCIIDPSTGVLSSCASTGSGFSEPQGGVSISNGYAYVGLTNGANITKCTVNLSTGTLSSCASTGSGFNGPAGVTINNSFAYITNSNNKTVSLCNVNPSTGGLSNCASTGSGFQGPNGVGVKNGFVYIKNAGNNTVSVCIVDPSTGVLSGCASTGSGFNGPAGDISFGS